jgi:hypothetical protein
MSYQQWFALLSSLLVALSLISSMALTLAVLTILEARWWRMQAIRRDPALSLADETIPPFVGRLVRWLREDAP